MSSVSSWVTFGLFLVATSSIDITAVPIPTALPPLSSRRYLEPPSPQAIENAKKYPRGWGPPPPPSEFFDPNFFPPNPYKEPPRGLIETNEIPQNNFDGYFPEEEFLVEEDDPNYLEPAYPGDPSYVVEPSQLAYIDPLGNHYQQTRPPYMSSELDESLEAENDSEKETTSDEVMEDNLLNNLAQLNAASQIILPTNRKFPQRPVQMPISLEYDSGEALLDSRLRSRGYNKPTFRPDSKGKLGKDFKTALEEPVVEKKPVQKDLFTRTTTITKTTTWYVDENNDLISKEEIDERPSPIKGKYSKKSKTTTSGPIPWYLKNFEEVIFEEENEKRKTILEKMPLLEGLNPTSITSFTTAPNPWSSEVHEEVVFEEFMTAKDNLDADSRGLKAHALSIDPVVEYVPMPKTIFEEIEDLEEQLLEELVEMLEEEGEVVVEVIIADFPPFAPIPMPQIQFPYPQFQPPMHPMMKPQTAPPQLSTTPQPSQPLQTPQPIVAPPTPEVVELKPEEEPKSLSDPLYPNQNELINGITSQITTPKPLTTMPPLIENNFTQYPPVGPIQGPEQMYPPQPNYNLPQPTQMPQLYGNLQTQPPNQNYPGPGGRRDFNGQLQQQGPNQRQMIEAQKDEQNRYQQRMDPEGKMKMVPPGPPGKQRQMYPQQQGMNRQQPRGRDL